MEDRRFVSFMNQDNALTVDFLTSAAGVLQERGFVASKEVDSLRVVLSGVQGQEQHQESLFLALMAQKAEFVETLRILFGDLALGSNLFRHAIKTGLSGVSESLGSFGTALLERSQTLFNRSFHTWVFERCEYRGLFSSTLVDLADIVAHSIETLAQAQQQCQVMGATALRVEDNGKVADAESLDVHLCRALGFSSSKRVNLPYCTERSVLASIGLALADVADGCESFVHSLRRNNTKGASPQLDLICDELRLESAKLRDARFFRGDDLETWEVRRLAVCLALNKFTHLLATLSSTVSKTISLDLLRPRIDSDDIHRTIAIGLLKKGVAAGAAAHAARRMTTYASLHKIMPREMILAELGKIDPALSADSLATLQTHTEDSSLNLGAAEEKKSNLGRSASLQSKFLARLVQTGSTMLLTAMLVSTSGCGLKTDPKSDVPDLRPDVPFRLQSLPPAKSQLPARPPSSEPSAGASSIEEKK